MDRNSVAEAGQQLIVSRVAGQALGGQDLAVVEPSVGQQ